MRDKFEEQMADQKEMDDILAEDWGPQVADESELLSELAELEEQAFAADIAAVPPAHVPAPAAVAPATASIVAPVAATEPPPMAFPAVPTALPTPAAPVSMEDELAALEAAM